MKLRNFQRGYLVLQTVTIPLMIMVATFTFSTASINDYVGKIRNNTFYIKSLDISPEGKEILIMFIGIFLGAILIIEYYTNKKRVEFLEDFIKIIKEECN